MSIIDEAITVTQGVINNGMDILTDNKEIALGTAAGLGVAALTAGTIATVSSIKKRKKKKSTKKRKSKSKSKYKRKSKRGKHRRTRRVARRRSSRRKQRKPYTARKGKDRSTRRIRYTKNNQPYVILSSGKARFIKKSSVSRSRKLKGGKY